MLRSLRARAPFVACALALTAAGAVATAPAAAQVAPGSVLSFSGSADAQDLGTPGVFLDFQPTVTANARANTGSFAQFNRPAGPAATGAVAGLLVGAGPQVVPNFLTIGGYSFTVRMLPSGPFGQAECYVDPAPYQTCTPYQGELGNPRPGIDALSPFYMTNLPSVIPGSGPLMSFVAFNLVGTVTGPGNATTSFFGTIATLLPASYQEVLGGLEAVSAGGGVFPGLPFYGTFVADSPLPPTSTALADAMLDEMTVTPEPGTVALVGAGLLGAAGLGGLARRRRP